MKIIVFDVPASEGGALTVLLDFYDYVRLQSTSGISWVFVVGSACLPKPPTDGRIRIIRKPDAKKNWASRIIFELIGAPKIIRQESPNVILSLQNLALLRTKIPQVIYVHQSLPYSNIRFSIFKREERSLAFISFLFGYLISWSVGKANKVIVQTKWLREAILLRHGINPEKIIVVPQAIEFSAAESSIKRNSHNFFYPASPLSYKNFEVIVDAAKILVGIGFFPKISLTIDGTENTYSKKIRAMINSSPAKQSFSLLGRIDRNKVLECMRDSTLLFPSKLESFGLPLLEARLIGAPVIASETHFSREVLEGYCLSTFFDPMSAKELANAMRNAIEKVTSDNSSVGKEINYSSEGDWGPVVDAVIESSKYIL